MINYIRGNINYAQELAKQKISLLLNNKNYVLVNDIHNIEGIETRIYQWLNSQTNHCIQLIWDSKEDWFELGEFYNTNNLNYLNAKQLKLVPLRTVKFFNRKDYINKKVDELIAEIKKHHQNSTQTQN